MPADPSRCISLSVHQSQLVEMEKELDRTVVYYVRQSLCSTLGGNECPLLTITSHRSDQDGQTADSLECVDDTSGTHVWCLYHMLIQCMKSCYVCVAHPLSAYRALRQWTEAVRRPHGPSAPGRVQLQLGHERWVWLMLM